MMSLEYIEQLSREAGEQADSDLHIKNIGRKNGKLVAIDFGIASELWC